MTSNDRADFTEMFERHRHGVHAFLLARTSDPEVARDLLQETFLRAWRRFDTIAGLEPDRRRAWLYTVARNLVIDGYRSRATRRATVAALTEESRDGATVGDAADEVVAQDELALVQRAISKLPDEERTVLTMSSVGNMNSQQIGEALSLPPGTVRYRLHRARTRLTQLLEDS